MKESGKCIVAILPKTMFLLAAFYLYSLSSQAQPSGKVCALISTADIATTGVKALANNQVPHGPAPLKKGVIPGLSTDCSEFSWGDKKGGKRIYVVNCGDIKCKNMVSLEFASDDQEKLPGPAVVKRRLDKMLARL